MLSQRQPGNPAGMNCMETDVTEDDCYVKRKTACPRCGPRVADGIAARTGGRFNPVDCLLTPVMDCEGSLFRFSAIFGSFDCRWIGTDVNGLVQEVPGFSNLPKAEGTKSIIFPCINKRHATGEVAIASARRPITDLMPSANGLPAEPANGLAESSCSQTPSLYKKEKFNG